MRLQFGNKAAKKIKSRAKKRIRIRKKVYGTEERPRLAVYRSSQHIYAQIIDDSTGKTLVESSTVSLKVTKGKSSREGARQVGQDIATKAQGKKISSVVFDRSGYLYHGRIEALAQAAREGGLKF